MSNFIYYNNFKYGYMGGSRGIYGTYRGYALSGRDIPLHRTCYISKIMMYTLMYQ